MVVYLSKESISINEQNDSHYLGGALRPKSPAGVISLELAHEELPDKVEHGGTQGLEILGLWRQEDQPWLHSQRIVTLVYRDPVSKKIKTRGREEDRGEIKAK